LNTAQYSGRVLVAEDETAIVRGITFALARAGFQAIVAENGAAGLETFLAEPDAIDLVLADVIMPVMDGITMVREIRKVRPQIPVLFMSAYPQEVVNAVNGPKFPLIRKPFLMTDLIRTIAKIFDRWPSVAYQPRTFTSP
jgi:two-component system cell cycle sensor histidine kinase/response regulator CckA